jgi:hypothetical protein
VPSKQKFFIDSYASALYGVTKTYELTAKFPDYTVSKTEEFDVEYVDPCLNPFDLNAKSQGTFTNKFDGVSMDYTVTAFDV